MRQWGAAGGAGPGAGRSANRVRRAVRCWLPAQLPLNRHYLVQMQRGDCRKAAPHAAGRLCLPAARCCAATQAGSPSGPPGWVLTQHGRGQVRRRARRRGRGARQQPHEPLAQRARACAAARCACTASGGSCGVLSARARRRPRATPSWRPSTRGWRPAATASKRPHSQSAPCRPPASAPALAGSARHT